MLQGRSIITPQTAPCRPVLEPTQTQMQQVPASLLPRAPGRLLWKDHTCQAYVELGSVTNSAENRAATCEDEGIGKKCAGWQGTICPVDAGLRGMSPLPLPPSRTGKPE